MGPGAKMPFKPITYGGKRIEVHKAIVEPDFISKTVLVDDTWDYVEMWLKRWLKLNPDSEDPLFYWQQAKQFFIASKRLPKTSSPLTAYYCFLNATKSLLLVKKKTPAPKHGVSGETTEGRLSLSNEIVNLYRGGVLGQLCSYLGEPNNNDRYNLKDMLYNLPYIHRAYTLTYRSSSIPELFFPIKNPIFVKKVKSTESWFCAEVADKKYANKHLINKLPNEFEKDSGVNDERFIIRKRNRFTWENGKRNEKNNFLRLINYHKSVRKHIYYIHGPSRLWYIKRKNSGPNFIPRSSLTLTYAAMFRLSELARYTPTSLAKHFDSRHNWLLSDFIVSAPTQFIDEISAEITGQEFMIPGRR